ncbi:helix-turn-helix transcriptional regulator [Moraxella oculi]|uniref:Helix-turn-helix transcriptional regulator n=1 Tax=Moraxella oculi TaxID=2940516 RepID=A0ABW8U6L8_9GAMM
MNQSNSQTSLPKDGMSRLTQLLPFLPIGKSTVWKWVKDGKFPQPIKLSPTVTVWRNSDIHQWLNEYSA